MANQLDGAPPSAAVGRWKDKDKDEVVTPPTPVPEAALERVQTTEGSKAGTANLRASVTPNDNKLKQQAPRKLMI
jgi:hypothetical protein